MESFIPSDHGRKNGFADVLTKEGTVSLPSKSIVRIPVHMGGKQAELYASLREELHVWVRDLSGDEVLAKAENILTRLIRLAQLLDGLLPGYMQDREKVIVWSSFVPNIEILRCRYPEYSAVALHGDMTFLEKPSAVTAFKSDRGFSYSLPTQLRLEKA